MSLSTADSRKPLLEDLARRVDDASKAVDELDPAARLRAAELQKAIEAFHKAGLTTIVRALRADPRGEELLYELAEDPGVYALFAMHGLVRTDLSTRVARVLEAARPYLQSHGGDVELVDVRGGKARVRLAGACSGCSMSAVTLRQSVEKMLAEHVPEIEGVEEVRDQGLVTLRSSEPSGEEHGWREGPPMAELEEARPMRFDFEATSLVLIRLGEEVVAFRNACAHQGLPIDGGRIDPEDGILTCPWHGFRFDAATGEGLTTPHARLEPFPSRVRNGVVWVLPR